MQSDVILQVIVPSYKKSGEIVNCLHGILTVFAQEKIPVEIIVVIDGDVDGTKNLLIDTKLDIKIITHLTNQGKGAAIKSGLREVTSNYVSFFDADLDIDPSVLVTQLKMLLSDKSIFGVIASKLHSESHVSYPLTRKILSFGLRNLQRLLFGLNHRDTQTGAKTFDSSVIKLVSSETKTIGFLYDLEILYLCSKRNLQVLECPVNITHNFTSTISFFHVLSLILDLLKLRMSHAYLISRIVSNHGRKS